MEDGFWIPRLLKAKERHSSPAFEVWSRIAHVPASVPLELSPAISITLIFRGSGGVPVSFWVLGARHPKLPKEGPDEQRA